MVLIDDELSLIEDSKKYLKAFLLDSGAFFPFAMIMDNEEIIYPLEPEVEDECPDPNILIDLFEKVFDNVIKTKSEYKLGILCIDIFIHSEKDGVNTKRSAIEIRLFGIAYRKKVMLYYEITETKEPVFQELVGWD